MRPGNPFLVHRSPAEIIDDALFHEENNPVIRRVCLTSGGGDSTVLAHTTRDEYDELVHIDTGTALPGVREFVHEFALFIDKPIRVVEAGDAYKKLVLGHDEWWPIYFENRIKVKPDSTLDLSMASSSDDWETPDQFRDRCLKLPTREQRMSLGANIAPLGFPGPAGHKFAYQKLKERQLERCLREIKAEFGNGKQQQRVVLLSGVRLAESERRKMTGTARGEWERKGNQVWVNPLSYWKNEEMAEYRREYDLPISDVTALIHKSGECQCLAFAAKGEREFIISLFPQWYSENIRPMEDEAKRRGLKHWQWGWGAGELLTERPEASGPMCQACDLRMGLIE